MTGSVELATTKPLAVTDDEDVTLDATVAVVVVILLTVVAAVTARGNS
jgi:hypothetical protein